MTCIVLVEVEGDGVRRPLCAVGVAKEDVNFMTLVEEEHVSAVFLRFLLLPNDALAANFPDYAAVIVYPTGYLRVITQR